MDDNGDVIEDDFTPRVSFGPSIEKAVLAMFQSGKHYIYACKSIPGKVDLSKKSGKFPTSRSNPYGTSFQLALWIKWAKKHSILSKKELDLLDLPYYDTPIRALKYSVPDAKITGELWATKPVTAKRIGTVYVNSNAYPKKNAYKSILLDKGILI
jgi:hypothetical protein